ncbi:hypothetical protein CONPUDRAFT_151654 [Coniophora puteana RWD-64-598 SS2]|uniref:Nephrocystin 3-like N-terminal domain-containing protein n=1 Tax=Coniophora puteana (strain RWD-64-598) TaxID=741705 RepID=A0A5M3MU53_CONPW|nr:uncharacterized protein CONPUDRAFT_151654 [Coniophora puteana RWD-64-598 SS2]EIW82580.1 hypothetical protein CONPUDRAFT_151654 [Coniophora puteana RWD-64-598 SS2]
MGSSREEWWYKLSQECAQGAIYDSSERQPHSRCLPGTRADILQDLKELVNNTDRKVIWISGEAGSGKSSIAHTFTDHLRGEGKLAATFFFSRKHAKRTTFKHVLLTIAYQLGLQHHRARDIIARAIADDPALLTLEKSHQDQLEKLVIIPLKDLAATVWRGQLGQSLILDALDEGTADGLSHLKPFIFTIFGLLRNQSLPIHNIIVTSRLWPQIRAAMHNQELRDVVKPLQVEDYDSRQDVDLFLRHSFDLIYNNHALFDFSIPQQWPHPDDFLMLSERAHGRFIFAATIVRLVDQHEPWDRLQLVCSMLRGNVEGIWGDIDHLYTSIMNSVEASVRNEAEHYLRLIVDLAEPLPLDGLRDLFAIDICSLLLPFSALISVPPTASTDVVQIYHTSFRDFLQNGNLGMMGQADVSSEQHHQLSFRCFKTMARLLKRDICGLRDPSFLHEEILGFPQKRDSVPQALVYSCRHWLYHLQLCVPENGMMGAISDFVERRLLHAIEVYAVLGELGTGAQMLRAARDLIMTWSQQPFAQKDLVLHLLHDAWRMTLDFFDPISSSALHIYESALPCCPSQSRIRATYGISEESVVLFEEGLDDQWSCVTREIETKFVNIDATSLSPDGSKIAVLTRLGENEWPLFSVKIWDTTTGRLLTQFEVPFIRTDFLSVHYNGSYLALYRKLSHELSLWHLPSGTPVVLDCFPTERTCPCEAVALSHDGHKMALMSLHDTASGTLLRIRIYRIETVERLLDYSVTLVSLTGFDRESFGIPGTMEFSNKNDLLLLHIGRRIAVFSATSGRALQVDNTRCGAHMLKPCLVIFSPNDDWIIHLTTYTDGGTEVDVFAVKHTTDGSVPDGSLITTNAQSPIQNPLKPLIEPLIYSTGLVGVKVGDRISSICGSSRTLWASEKAEWVGALVHGRHDGIATGTISVLSVRQASQSTNPQRSNVPALHRSWEPGSNLRIYAYDPGDGFHLVSHPTSDPDTTPLMSDKAYWDAPFKHHSFSPKSKVSNLGKELSYSSWNYFLDGDPLPPNQFL